ncbi:MAG: GDSL-type esterase/lipase family protein [Opitutales bacterium]
MQTRFLIAWIASLTALLSAAESAKSTVTPVTQDRDRATYNWMARHAAILELNKARQPQVVLIGDSITHFWGGAPRMGPVRGSLSWAKYLEPRGAANLGYGWDMTENVLWRLRHGEVDGLRPTAIVLLIGTNNLEANTTEDIVLGIKTIVSELRQRCPGAKLLLLSLPRGTPQDPLRAKAAALAKALDSARLGDATLDLSARFIQVDGTIPRSLMSDLLHPTEAGYEIMGEAVDKQLRAWGI